MPPIELFQGGRLRDAIRAQDRVVRAQPRDAAARLLLCEFTLFAGDIHLVREYLGQLPDDLPGMEGFLDDYRLLLDAEEDRRHILFGSDVQVYPFVPIDPPRHIRDRIAALAALRMGEHQRCVELLDDADALVPEINGHVDGREFHGVRDGDDLFAPVLEVLIGGRYAWFPFDQIARLRLGPIESLRDRLFVPAMLRARTGAEWQVHLPAHYPGTSAHEDDEVRIGQATDWYAEEGGPARGVGLRLITFGEEELTLLDFALWEG